jgi:hypothetical protein
MESFQPGLSFGPVSRAEISARPKDKILRINKNNRLNGFILRVCFIFKYFTYKHSLTQIKWWTNQRLTA